MSRDAFVLHTTKDKLAAAPGFDLYSDTDNLKWATDVYRFFVVKPYWSEQGTL